jgi:TetR/AcrR family transcriptional regulator
MSNQTDHDRKTAALILQAAEEQFSRFGYAKVTMEEIAEQAGLGKASLYYYHSTKEELFHAVLHKKFAEFEVPVQRLLESDAPVPERIRQYVKERHIFFDRLLSLNITDFKAIPKNRPVIKNFFEERAALETQWLTQLFDEGRRSGVFAMHSSERTALAFLHIMQGLRLRYLRSQESAPSRSDTRDVHQEMEYITAVFLRGIQRTADSAGQPCQPDHHEK